MPHVKPWHSEAINSSIWCQGRQVSGPKIQRRELWPRAETWMVGRTGHKGWAGAGPEGPSFASSSRETSTAGPTSAVEEGREHVTAASPGPEESARRKSKEAAANLPACSFSQRFLLREVCQFSLIQPNGVIWKMLLFSPLTGSK